MSKVEMEARMSTGLGFIAALDQSGGSSAAALKAYGIAESSYSNDTEMFALIRAFRERIMTAPSFSSDRVIAAILFEATMDDVIGDMPVPSFLWATRGIVPFVKVDKGLEAEAHGVSLMKPMPALEPLLERAIALGIFGTKMRSTIRLASRKGITAVVEQQFDFAGRIAQFGLLPILEPEILITSPDKAFAESILLDELLQALNAHPGGGNVMIKLSTPETRDHYAPLIAHPRVKRLVALSGGYTRDEACRRLATNTGMIGSFSRALIGDLRHGMDDLRFDATLKLAVDQIYHASITKI